MPVENIYDMYNQYLTQDQPVVDAMVTAILAEINNVITNNLEPKFNFVVTPYLENLDMNSKTRIIDQVIFYFRNNGIRCYINNPSFTDPYAYAVNYNRIGAEFTELTISWTIRSSREYMKTYC